MWWGFGWCILDIIICSYALSTGHWIWALGMGFIAVLMGTVGYSRKIDMDSQ